MRARRRPLELASAAGAGLLVALGAAALGCGGSPRGAEPVEAPPSAPREPGPSGSPKAIASSAPPGLSRESPARRAAASEPSDPPAPEPAAPAALAAPRPATTPESPPQGTQPLPVEGFLPALVSWPDAQSWPQPVLIAAHGAGDDPETHCELWRRLLGPRGVILCLRGRAMAHGAGGYFFSDHHTLKRETLAALEALRRASPGRSDTSLALYAGYSQGAQMGLLMLADDGSLAPRLLLVEGGSGDFGALRVARFRRSGGQAVALVCGTPGCSQRAERSRERLEHAGLRASAAYVPGAGHTYLGEMVPKIVEAFGFLTKGDRRWSPPSEGSAPGSLEPGGSGGAERRR